MSKNTTDTNQASEDKLPNWVCIPDEDASHLTTYKQDEDGFGGCPKHVIAGGCSIPQDELRDLIRTEKLKLLAEVREKVVGEDDEPRNILEHSRRNFLRAEQRTALTKLEAEL